MLRRKIDQTLENWKRTKNNQGILVTGARQVGKTSSIEAFAGRHYDNIVKIDFVEQPAAVQLIAEAKDLDDLEIRITALSPRPLSKGHTLLFFDEVQRCGDAITWMRYLAEDDRFDVVYSGSMLEIEAYDLRSLPAGTIDIVEMFPMDFEEFCWGNGVNEEVWDIVRQCFQDVSPVPGFIHEKLLDLFARYVLVGGMPEAVQTFVSTNDTQALRTRQKSIMAAYRHDIVQYIPDKDHAQRVKTIFDAIPAQLNKENRRFYISGIDKKKRFSDMESDFDWLAHAGVALPAYRATEARFPLGLSIVRSYFKLYLCDVGLLFSTFASADVQAVLRQEANINLGGAYENAVAQELRAHGHGMLAYLRAKGIGKVDFLLEDAHEPVVIPVEVKSGKYPTKHAALDRLMSVKNYRLKKPVVLSRLNVEDEDAVLYAPLYMAALL